jgi:hypothetical protein
METSSELLKLGLFNDITLYYRILQAVSVKTLPVRQKARERAHHPTTAPADFDGPVNPLRTFSLPDVYILLAPSCNTDSNSKVFYYY